MGPKWEIKLNRSDIFAEAGSKLNLENESKDGNKQGKY